jgi:hypothetical protein
MKSPRAGFDRRRSASSGKALSAAGAPLHRGCRWIEAVAPARHPVILPVEVIPFAWQAQSEFLAQFGAQIGLRSSAEGAPFITDNGNDILNCRFGPLRDAGLLAAKPAARRQSSSTECFWESFTRRLWPGRKACAICSRTRGFEAGISLGGSCPSSPLLSTL